MRKWMFALVLAVAGSLAAAPIRLAVDATDAPRRVLHAHLAIPAVPGALTLAYPKWIPGEHGPTGPLVQMAGLRFTANGKVLEWRRDPVDMYAFHLDLPQGTSEVLADLDYLDPVGSGSFTAGGSMSPRLAVISWNTVLLYPAATRSDDVTFEASLKLPAGWDYATALATTGVNAGEIRFAPISLTHLVDSPVLSGVHMKKVEIRSASPFAHRIDIVSDDVAALAVPDDFAAGYGRLVDEFRALLGAEHFRHYDWLLTVSDNVAHFGLEHHESSDDRTTENALADEGGRRGVAGLLAHEYAHSWNGKFRRPAGLATSNYQLPMTGELLWVYEGLTTYLGNLMPYRAAMAPADSFREALALGASTYQNRPGRSWRPLEDTAVEAQILYEAPGSWSAYRRGVDFYEEGALLWLDADMTIRQLTGDRKSLDDFLRSFYGGSDGDPVVKPYTFDDVVRSLNAVAPYDWASFLNSRLRSTAAGPLGGIETSGWRLVYNDKPNEALQNEERRSHSFDAMTTLGMTVGSNGRVADVVPNGPAAKAGIVPGTMLIAINGRRYSADALRNAIRDSKTATAPIQVISESENFYSVTSIDYHGGARYPHLERIEGKRDRLADLVKPLAKK